MFKLHNLLVNIITIDLIKLLFLIQKSIDGIYFSTIKL